MSSKQLSIWIVCLLVLLSHQITQKIGHWPLPFLDSYLDPFLSMPILMGGIIIERSFLLCTFYPKKVRTVYRFSIFEIIVISIFFALLFEEGFPYWSQDFTRDEWDYVAYFFGSLVFYFFMNGKEETTNTC